LVNYYGPSSIDRGLTLIPTDRREMVDFIYEVEGKTQESTGVALHFDPASGLLTRMDHSAYTNVPDYQIIVKYNSLDETDFQNVIPSSAKVVDQRDAIHKQGWAYFRVRGKIDSMKIEGYGRIPFYYHGYREQHPWMVLDIGSSVRLVDVSNGAYVLDTDEKILAAYHSLSFFEGLSRPWAGFHTYDTIGRDAAKRRLVYSYEFTDDGDTIYLTLNTLFEDQPLNISYTIDVKRDLVLAIYFMQPGSERPIGQLEFEYLTSVDPETNGFDVPDIDAITENQSRLKKMDTFWLGELQRPENFFNSEL
jgi:hypothetical protein